MHHLTCGVWNQLPSSFRQPHYVHSLPGSPHPAHITLSQSPPSLSSPVTSSTFHSITPDLNFISFTNPFLHSHSYSFRTAFTDLKLYCIKGALALFVLVSFSGFRVHVKLFYRIVSYCAAAGGGKRHRCQRCKLSPVHIYWTRKWSNMLNAIEVQVDEVRSMNAYMVELNITINT